MKYESSGNQQKKSSQINSTEFFWKEKSLLEMNSREWELLCDGCGKCCLHKFQDEEKIEYTNVCCKLLCIQTCRCTSYKYRHLLVPTCMILTPSRVEKFFWLPESCAYRLLYQGKDLPPWHHLVCGDRDLIHRSGFSVRGKVISEIHIHPLQLEQHIVKWPYPHMEDL
jgi:uncharacterized cysteine cluster protein YcgN (CxxCxxCC family)